MRRPNIQPSDLMDAIEVAEAFGVARSSLAVALNKPEAFPSLAARLPAPLRKIGNAHVWLRYDVEKALRS